MIVAFIGEHRFLSNFFPSRILYEGRLWETAEHAYQAAKTEDLYWRDRILHARTPGAAKYLGRKVPMRSDWDDIKLRIMRDIVEAKFLQNDDLAVKLALTGNEELVEGNTWGDRFWGVSRGHGLNHLGKILMDVRTQLVNDAERSLVSGEDR